MTFERRPPTRSVEADERARRARAGAAWRRLGDRLATVTPSAVGRAALTAVVGVLILGLTAGTWPALLPFLVGGLLAYAVLPVVDALDRVLPRSVAAVITMLAAVAALVAAFAIVIPPLAVALIDLAGSVPPGDRLGDLIEDALSGLPDDVAAAITPTVVGIAVAIRSGLDGAAVDLDTLWPAVARAALGVVGAFFGLLVLPSWMLSVLRDRAATHRAIDRRLAGWLRPDAWAVIRMFDRAAGSYLRGFVVIAIAVGLLTWLGLTASPQLGGPTFQGGLALATLAGLLQLVPEIGPVLGLLPALLLLLVAPERAAVYLASYVAARLVAGWLLGGRRLEAGVRVHPAVLIPGIVVLSQLGPLWLFLSAPILTFGSDLVRYLHGRLSEPPRPAGVLPGEPLPSTAVAAADAAGLPPIYRARPAGPPPLTAEPLPTAGARPAPASR